MSEIPEDIVRIVQRLNNVGCTCDEIQYRECPHFRGGYCLRPQDETALAILAERDRCAGIIKQIAASEGRQECCGFGRGSPPECCAAPLILIDSAAAVDAIRDGATVAMPAHASQPKQKDIHNG